MIEVFYKIKHKPTGLYYKPGTTNLTKTGKTYAKKPTLKIIIWGGNFRVSEVMAKKLKSKGYPVATHKKEVWGLPQETNFHFARDPDPDKNQAIIKLRCYLRNYRGYDIPGKAGMVVFITAETKRSPKMEARAQKLGMIIREKK